MFVKVYLYRWFEGKRDTKYMEAKNVSKGVPFFVSKIYKEKR